MTLAQPQIAVVFDRRKKASLTVKSAVEIRITYNYKQKWISTGIKLYSNQWKKGKIVNCTDIEQISKTLDTLISNIRQILLEMIQKGNIDIMRISEEIERKNKSKIGFIDFCKQRAEVRKYGKSTDSQERYNRFLKYFIQWGGITSFEDITDANIIIYDKYLRSRKLKNSSIWNNYHRFLNSFILDAVEAGLIKRNPYRWINIERKRIDTIERALSLEEFNIIRTIPLCTLSLERVRDLFVFQTYTCLRYSDLATFDTKYIQEVKGMKVYMRDSKKTGKPFTVPLLSPALEILDKYEGKLPIISNVKYNLYLKAIAQIAKIDKPVSTHWARHTGATILYNEGVDMKIISKICGHTSTKITEQIYAKLLDETVVDAVSKIEI